MILLLLVGFLSILGQVVLLRELAVAFYGVELVYLLALGVWLLAGAAGALSFGGRRRRPNAARSAPLALLVAASGVVLLLEVVFIRGSRILFGGVPGAYLTFGQQLSVMALGLAPASALLGLLFQRAARRAAIAGRTLAVSYAVESAGGLVGGLVSAVGLSWGVSNLALGVSCAAAGLTAGAVTWRPRPVSRRIGLAAGTALAVVALFSACPATDWRTTRWNHPSLVATDDSPYGRVTVARAGAQISVFENDSLSFETEGTEAERFVHLAALAHPAPRRVLLLGGTIEAVVGKVLEHGPERVDVVEPNRRLLATIVPQLPLAARAALDDRRVFLTVDDPRRFLRDAASYDLILVSMPEPSSGQANRFYTREFFEQAARRLNPGGILAFRLQAAENYWTPTVLRRTRSIHLALSSAFPHVVVLPGSSLVLLASNRPLEVDAGILGARLAARGIRARLVSPAYISYVYSNDRFAETAARLAAARAPENTDSRPICYQFSALIWLSKFFPALGGIDPVAGNGLPFGLQAVAAGAVALGLLAIGRVGRLRRVLLVAAAGGIGMVIETTLLLHYQLTNGVVYRDLGLLLTAFMAGLASGAWLFHRLIARAGSRCVPRGWGIALVLLSAGLAVVTSALMAAAAAAWLPLTCALLASAGLLVSAIFAYASLRGIDDQDRIVAPLYAADLLGGAAGCLATSLLLIPLVGLTWTVGWTAAASAGLLGLV